MKEYSLNELAVILLDGYEGFEYKHKASILGLYKNAEDIFFDNSLAVEYARNNIGDTVANTLSHSLNRDFAFSIKERLDKKGVSVITYNNSEYPRNLLNYPLYPLAFYAKGNLDLLKSEKMFGVVGSRKTMPFVLRTIEGICEDLTDNGYVIVTGSAVGGDRSAIIGALKSGKIISVLAHGSDYIYPESNRSLIQKVSENGLIISEYPPETPSAPWRFPMRNRIIAALSGSVLIASGSMTSGTRYTAKFAEAYSKNIYAFPYSLGEKSGEICNLLLKLGKAHLIENSEDIALCEGFELKEKNIDLTQDELKVLRAIDGQSTIDFICEQSGLKAYEVMPVLSMLEIKKAVAKGVGNTYTALIKVKNDENNINE